MAEAESENEIVLKQMKNSPFSGEAGVALNAFLEGLSAFGAEFSRVADTLIQFFQATKLFLEAFKNPLTAALIETIDSLIEALEEMQSLGFGSLTVWPWEHGVYPPQVQTEKLDESIVALAAAMQGIDVESMKINERGEFVGTKNGETLLTPGQEINSGGSYASFQSKSAVYDTMLSIRNFFHPELWTGPTTPSKEEAAASRMKDKLVALSASPASFEAAKNISGIDKQSFSDKAADWGKDTLHNSIKFTQKNLFVRELPPEECVRQIIASLSGSAPDNNKPTGSGPYKAFMIMFALPSINGIIQVIQSFADYFGDVIGDEVVEHLRKNSPGTFDEKVQTISLGEPLSKPKFTLAEMSNSEWFFESGDFQPTRGLEDGKYKVGGKINMFKPGDLLVQEGGVLGFSSFSAEVVEHYPIVIQKGMILDNRVKVKGARGEFIKTNQKSLNSATIPVVRAVSKKFVSPRNHVIFRTDSLEKPIDRTAGQFFGTIISEETIIRDIIPNNVTGQLIRTACKNAYGTATEAQKKIEEIDEEIDYFLEDEITGASLAEAKDVKVDSAEGLGDVDYNTGGGAEDSSANEEEDEGGERPDLSWVFDQGLNTLLGGDDSESVVSSYMEFLSDLTKGSRITHSFLKPMELSDEFSQSSFFTGSKMQFNYGKLLDALPGLGVNYYVANILLNGEPVENMSSLTKEKVFVYPSAEEVGTTIPRPTSMNKLEFELGFLNHDGSFDTDFGPFDIGDMIDPPNGGVYSWETKIGRTPNQAFVMFSANKNVSPNWKYIRISDLFPVYGSTIQEAIGQVKKFKKQVEDISKKIDQYIKFLERQIKAIKRLNDQIQQLIAFFSQGLNAAGLYTAQFSGDGVKDFKNQLSTLKMVQTAKNKIHEISLETVESETTIKDPFTGLPKTVKRKVLRPSILEQDIEPDGIPKPLSELSNLKFSGAVVFFAQGPDVSKFDTFMNNFNGLATLGKGFLANLMDSNNTIAQRISPYVHQIQGEDADGNFIDIEELGSIDAEGTIRVVFTNAANNLDKTEREMLNKQMEKSVDFSPKIQMGSISLTNSEDASAPTKNDSIVLFQGTYDESKKSSQRFSHDSTFHQFLKQPKTNMVGRSTADEDGDFEKQYFNVDLKPKNPLKRSAVDQKYKLVIQTSIINQEGLSLKKRHALEIGFMIKPVTVVFGELI